MSEGDGVVQLQEATSGDQAIAVNGSSADVDSQAIETFRFGSNFGLAINVSSGGLIDINLKIKVSHDNVNFFVPQNFNDIDSELTTSGYKIYVLPIPPFPYFKLNITGEGSNAASTVVEAWVSGQRTI